MSQTNKRLLLAALMSTVVGLPLLTACGGGDAPAAQPPAATTPAPAASTPAPVASAPAPVASAPAPVASAPAPVASAPAPIASAPAPVASAPAPVASAPVASNVNVSGNLAYEFVPPAAALAAGLNYNGIQAKPIRGATVQALGAGGAVIASTVSTGTGSYALSVPVSTSYTLRVRAELLSAAGAATWNVKVQDNTAANALWTLDAASANSGAANASRNLTAASGWGGSSYTGPRAAAPFAILDAIYDSVNLVVSANANSAFPAVTVNWSPNNRPVGGNLSGGDIGTSFFQSASQGGNVTRNIYILGAANVDTDEYDRSVVIHEFGHYLQDAFSFSDSQGGPHGGGDRLDMGIAFGEGFGNAWSGMAGGTTVYRDSSGQSQTSSFGYDLAALPGVSDRGWYSERSVSYVLFSLFQSQGFTPIWTSLRSTMLSPQQALATIHSFAAGVRTAGGAAVTGALDALLRSVNIGVTDEWGSGETNNGGLAQGSLPIYDVLTPGGAGKPVCFSTLASDAGDLAPNGNSNKLGTTRYFRFTQAAAGARTIRAVWAEQRDQMDFVVQQNHRDVGSGASSNIGSEEAVVNLAAGETIVIVRLYNEQGMSQTPACGTITVN